MQTHQGAEEGNARDAGQPGEGARLIAIQQSRHRGPLAEAQLGFVLEHAAGDHGNAVDGGAAEHLKLGIDIQRDRFGAMHGRRQFQGEAKIFEGERWWWRVHSAALAEALRAEVAGGHDRVAVAHVERGGLIVHGA